MQQARGTKKPNQSKSQNINPFAKALAETDPSSSASGKNKTNETSLFSEALAQAGGKLPQDSSKKGQEDFLKKQQQEKLEAAEKKTRIREFHNRVNPVEQADVFSAREKQVKEEINKLRYELKMLDKEVSQFNSEVEKTLMSEIAQPGTSGTYYINFFQRLRAFIMLLRQKVKSARTWFNHTNNKKAKKGPRGPGAARATKTKSVHDTFHHERSNAMGGG